MKSIFTSLTLLAVVYVLLPDMAAAQSDFFVCEGVHCSACDFADLGNRIVSWLLGIVAMLFSVLMAVAGVRLVTSGGNQTARDNAKSSLTNAIIGLIIILAAWLLVDTIMRTLVGNDGKINGRFFWSEIQCWDQVTPGAVAFQAEQDFIRTGGDHGGGPAAGGGSNCPATPESEVVQIPGSIYKAKPDVVADFVRMKEAAARDGVTLTVTNGWRSEATQVSYWNRRSTLGLVARPCSLDGGGSNHNSGNAIDISVRPCAKAESDCNQGPYVWLRANAADYGFYNNLPTDILHWSRTGR